MDKKWFVAKMEIAEPEMDKEQMEKLLRIVLSEPGGYDRACAIAVEELSELQKEICKMIRHKGDRMDLLQEIADVCIVLHQQIVLEGYSEEELNRAINVKLERLKKGYR